jgi:hypothetical protein
MVLAVLQFRISAHQLWLLACADCVERWEYDMATLLDSDDSPTGQGKSIANKIVTHAIGVLSDLADLQQRGIDDFRCTLLVWIGGNRRALWFKGRRRRTRSRRGWRMPMHWPSRQGRVCKSNLFHRPTS